MRPNASPPALAQSPAGAEGQVAAGAKARGCHGHHRRQRHRGRGPLSTASPVDLWTGPLARASRLNAPGGVHLWMAGWTTLRVAHAPTHRPSAAHKLHRAPPREMEKYKQYPARCSGIARPTTSGKEAANQPAHLHSYNLNRATQHRAPDRSRSRNHRSRSPKCAAWTTPLIVVSPGSPSRALIACPATSANDSNLKTGWAPSAVFGE